MKMPCLLRHTLTIGSLSLALAATGAFAASQTWTNAPADATWLNTNNWVARALPGATNQTGNTVNNDVVTFNTPIAGTIGGAANPILSDDGTIVVAGTPPAGGRGRTIGGITFDTINCGAYVISNTSVAALPTTTTPETGILNVCHNGSIQMTATVTNSQRILVPLYIRLPSSTAGIYNFVNNSTNAATLYIGGATNDSATTRGTVFTLGGSNTGTNTVGGLSSGTSTGTAGNGLTKQGDGTWILAGANNFIASTVVQVLGGKLIVNDPGVFGPATSVTVSNSILQMNAITLNQVSVSLSKGGNIRMNGVGTVNGVAVVGTVTANNATVSTANATDVFSVGTGIAVGAAVTGGASDSVLNTAGPGTLIFGQPNTYVGRWAFGAATNQLSNASGLGTGPNASVNAGAILDLTPLGATSFVPTTTGFGGSGTGSAVGSSAAAVLADVAGILDLSGKSVNLIFTPASSAGDTTHPPLCIAQGTLALSGNTFFVNNAGPALGVGTYRLIQQASGNITSGGGYAVLVSGNGTAGGTTADIQVSGGNVNLVVSPYIAKNLVWTGGNPNTTWDTATTANFLNGAARSVFNVSDNATFNPIGATNPVVTLSGTLAPGILTVDTSGNDYTFSGPGQVGGPGGLTKVSSGILLLQSANSYAGGTVVSNGTLRYGTPNAVSSTGNGDVALYNGGTLDLNSQNGAINGLNGNGIVDITSGGTSVLSVGNNDKSGTFTGVLTNTSGTLSLTKVGTNTQVLSASNSYAGPTTINLGTLATVNEHALGIGDLSLTGGTLDVRTSRLFLNSLAATGGTIVNNTTTTTNTLIITGTSTTTFSGVIADGTGGGGMALTVLGGSLTIGSQPSTYTGGTIVGSGASFSIANGPAGITGGLIASNGATLGLSGGSAAPGTPTTMTTVDGATVTLTSGAEGKIWNGQWIGSANTTNHFTSPVSAGGTLSFSNFLGLVQIDTGTANFRFFNDGGVSGGTNTIFQLLSGNVHVRGSSLQPQTVFLGCFVGGSSTSGIGGPGTTNALPTTWVIGDKGLDMDFHGYFTSAAGLASNNLVKSGVGRLSLDGVSTTTNTDGATFTNYLNVPLITHYGTTTVSNGLLVITCPNDLSNSPSVTLAASSAVLDASQMGVVSNFTDVNGDNSVLITNGILHRYSGQSLNGLGTLRGKVIADAGSVVAPGLPVGILTITNGATLNGAINFSLNRLSTPNSGRLAAPSVDVTGATIIVTNIGLDLNAGDSFQLFSVPVTGIPAAVNLPTTFATGSYVWTNKLAIDGTIQVLVGAPPVNTARTNITNARNGNTLELSWPTDHTGWTLQSNSVSLVSTGSWFAVPGSAATNRIIITLDPTKPTVFYRMIYP